MPVLGLFNREFGTARDGKKEGITVNNGEIRAFHRGYSLGVEEVEQKQRYARFDQQKRALHTPVTHPGAYTTVIHLFNTPREAITRVKPPYIHTQGGYNPGYTPVYTHPGRLYTRVNTVIHTQGDYIPGLTPLYTPKEAITRV